MPTLDQSPNVPDNPLKIEGYGYYAIYGGEKVPVNTDIPIDIRFLRDSSEEQVSSVVPNEELVSDEDQFNLEERQKIARELGVEYVSTFHCGRAYVIRKDRYCVLPEKPDRYFFIDRRGEQVTREYDYVRNYSEGLAVVGRDISQDEDGETDRLYHYINTEDKRAFPATFVEADNFSEGLAAVRISYGSPYQHSVGEDCIGDIGDCHYINRKGEIVIKGPFAEAGRFENGEATVGMQLDTGCKISVNLDVINREGIHIRSLGPFNLEDFDRGDLEFAPGRYLGNGLFAVWQNTGGWKDYLVNEKGVGVGVRGYDSISEFDDGVAQAELDGERVFIDTKGNIVFDNDPKVNTAFEELIKLKFKDDWLSMQIENSLDWIAGSKCLVNKTNLEDMDLIPGETLEKCCARIILQNLPNLNLKQLYALHDRLWKWNEKHIVGKDSTYRSDNMEISADRVDFLDKLKQTDDPDSM